MANKLKVEVDLKQIHALASKGYNTSTICEAIGISRSYAYGNKAIKDTIKRGASEARQGVIDDLMKRSKGDLGATATIFLAKQLKVFEEYFSTSRPKTPEEALVKIGNIYEAVARNELSSEKGDKLIHYLEVFVKTLEVSELAESIAEIQKQLNDQKKF